MRLTDTIPCRKFVAEIDAIAVQLGGTSLSKTQTTFISFCIGSMVMLGSLNFAAFAAGSLGLFAARALSWMLHHSKIDWNTLLKAAVVKVLVDHGVSTIHAEIDDTDRTRSKVIKILWGVFKTIDKVTGGWINAQNIVFLCLVTDKITIPVMFAFYRPDPVYSAWAKQDKKLRKKKVTKRDRPSAPKRDKRYPTKIEIAMKLLAALRIFLSTIEPLLGRKLKLSSIAFDCAYLSPRIARFCHRIFPKIQVISQIASNQVVWSRTGKPTRVDAFFKNIPQVEKEIFIRGAKQKVSFLAARLTVKSHGRLLHIVALKYEGEAKYRYLAATGLTWRSENIIRAYALRWLIEVANFDWKQHDGWGRGAYQHGADGACRGVILSLLVDCFLLTHPAQLRQSRAGLPLYTAGSVVRRIQYDNLLESIEEIFASPDPQKALKDLVQCVDKVIVLTPSTKHMVGVEIADLGPSPSLQRIWSKTG
jgi:hypothetical protein